MNQKQEKDSLASTLALVGSGVGLGLGLAGLAALWLQRTDMLVRGRAANVDKQLDAIRERQNANDAQLAADLALFRQVLQAYQPTPEQGYFGSFSQPAPAFPPSVLADASPAAEAAYEAINRNRNPDVALPALDDVFNLPVAESASALDVPTASATSVEDYINGLRATSVPAPEGEKVDLGELMRRGTASANEELTLLFGPDE